MVIFDQAVGKILRYLYFNQKAGQQQSLNYIFSDLRSDILIFGNSRAQHHYDSQILSDSLKLSCFNAGQDGGHSILLPDAQLKIILKRYTPKIVLLEFEPCSVKLYNGDYERLSILLPYLEKYPELLPLIIQRSPFERIKLISAIYPFNSHIINLIRFNTNTHSARKRDNEGYVPLTGKELNFDLINKSSNLLQNENDVNQIADTNKLNALKNIIYLCQQHYIKLIIINSPVFHYKNDKPWEISLACKQALKILQDEKVEFLDFTRDPDFADRLDLFADVGHLNDKGAKVFTSKLSCLIKNNELISSN